MGCLVYLIFDLCLFYESRCANPASADLVRMLGALLQFPFYSYPSHPFVPLGWLFIIFLFFCLSAWKKRSLQCCAGINNLLQLSLSLFCACMPKISAQKCTKHANICTKMHLGANTSIQRRWSCVK